MKYYGLSYAVLIAWKYNQFDIESGIDFFIMFNIHDFMAFLQNHTFQKNPDAKNFLIPFNMLD